MALINRIVDPLEKSQFVLGKFLQDGRDCAACFTDYGFNIHLLNTANFLKIKCVEIPIRNLRTVSLTPHYVSDTCDHLVVTMRGPHKYTQVGYWDGEVYTELAQFQVNVTVRSPPCTEGIICVSSPDRFYVYKDRRLAWRRKRPCASALHFLDTDFVLISGIGTLELCSTATGKVHTSFARPKQILSASWLSPEDKTKILVIYGSWGGVLDIKNRNADFRFNGYFGVPPEASGAKLHTYLEGTGTPVFKNPFFIFYYNKDAGKLEEFKNDRCPLNSEFSGRNYYIPSLSGSMADPLEVYTYKLAEGEEIHFSKVSPDLMLCEKPPSLCFRNTCGSTYLYQHCSRGFTMCLGFETINMKDMSSFGYTEEFFLIDGGNLLLTCAAGTDVISAHSYKRYKSWRCTKPTVFASSNFQVCANSVHTSSKVIENLLQSEICKACEHELGVVIASATQLAILNHDLEIVKFIDESLIMSVFPEGYATQSSLVFFSGDVHTFPESTILSVEKDLETLIVLFLNGKAVYSVAGGPFKHCNLGWPAIKYIRNCGSGVQVFGGNESVLLHKNAFFKLHNCTGLLLASKNLESCFTFTNGILERKAVVGLTPRFINFSDIYEKAAVPWVASNNLVTSWRGNVVTITSLSTNITQTIELPGKDPNRIYLCWAISESLMVCLLFGADDDALALVTYRTTDMQQIDVSSIPHMNLANDLQEAIRIRESTLFVSHNGNYGSWVSIYNIDENGHIVEDPLSQSLETHKNALDSSIYLLGSEFHEYTDRGDYFLYTPIPDPLRLVPKSTPAIPFNKISSRSTGCYPPAFLQSKEDIQTYFVAYSIIKSLNEDEFRLVKLGVNGNEELVTSFSKRRITNIRVLEYSGDPIKYQPSFIVSADDGSLFTVAILPEAEAKQLAAIQQEIVGIPKNNYGIPRVDAQTLKRIVDDPTTHPIFEKHGINVAEFKANLGEALQ